MLNLNTSLIDRSFRCANYSLRRRIEFRVKDVLARVAREKRIRRPSATIGIVLTGSRVLQKHISILVEIFLPLSISIFYQHLTVIV